MKLLLLYLTVTVAGYFVGGKLKKLNKETKWVGKVQTIAIIILVGLMGMRLGANEEVIKGLTSIGITSFIFTLIVMAGSVAAVFIARKLLGIDRKGVKSND